MNNVSPPGWYQDPTGQADSRYWNGTSWTQSVQVGGTTQNVPIDPTQAMLPPTPGTQMSVPTASTPPENRNSVSPVWIFVGLAIVLLIGVVIFAIVNDDGDSNNPGSTPTAPATEAPATPATEAPATSGG